MERKKGLGGAGGHRIKLTKIFKTDILDIFEKLYEAKPADEDDLKPVRKNSSQSSIEDTQERKKPKEKSSKPKSEGWDDDWDSWDDEPSDGSEKTTSKATISNTKSSKPKASPILDTNVQRIRDSLIAISRDHRLMVFAHDTQLAFVHLEGKQSNIELISEKHCDPGDGITQVVILPLAISTNSERGNSLCVGIGYKSGYLKIFTETGTIILSQIFHKSPILKFKLRTTPVMPGSLGRQTEDLCILYPNGVVASIDGLSLYTLLQTYMIQVERSNSGYDGMMEETTLAYRKWELNGQGQILDIITTGVPCYSPSGILRPLPSSTPLIAVGKESMIGFYIPSGEESPFSTAVALASNVANKLTSAVFTIAKNWWSRGTLSTLDTNPNPSSVPAPVIEKAIYLPMKWYLSDPKRHVTSIMLDPIGRLAVTVDAFGRVMLIDVIESTIVRMWKGYRDAQCAWLQEKQSTQTSQKNVNSSSSLGISGNILCLVIYLPKRGILEVWKMRNGERIALLDVGTGCKLLPTQSPLGAVSGQYQPASCYLLNPEGLLQEIDYKIQ